MNNGTRKAVCATVLAILSLGLEMAHAQDAVDLKLDPPTIQSVFSTTGGSFDLTGKVTFSSSTLGQTVKLESINLIALDAPSSDLLTNGLLVEDSASTFYSDYVDTTLKAGDPPFGAGKRLDHFDLAPGAAPGTYNYTLYLSGTTGSGDTVLTPLDSGVFAIQVLTSTPVPEAGGAFSMLGMSGLLLGGVAIHRRRRLQRAQRPQAGS